MAIQALRAIETFANTVSEDQDGITFIVNFKVELTGVETASASERSLIQATALTALGIPQYGAQFAGNSAAFVVKRSVKTISGEENNIPRFCIVTCTFSSKPTNKRDEEENPLDKIPDIRWSSHFERQAILNALFRRTFQNGAIIGKDQPGDRISGKLNGFNQFNIAITNSAGEPFSPSPEKDIPFSIITISENIARNKFDPASDRNMIGTVNKETFRVDGVEIDKQTALLLDRTSDSMYQGKTSYRKVDTTILLKDTHDLVIQDKGFLYKGNDTGTSIDLSTAFGGSDGTESLFVFTNGSKSPDELLLDGLGNILTRSVNDGAVYIHYRVHELTDFTKLNLPREKI